MDTKITPTVTDHMLRAALCGAFEGGSTHWVEWIEPDERNPLPAACFFSGGSRQVEGEYWHWAQLMPLATGCGVMVRACDDPQPVRLDREALSRGLRLMAILEPATLGRLVAGDDTGRSGDVLLQLSLFGETIFA